MTAALLFRTSAIMDQFKLILLVLLLTPSMCFESKVSLVKTVSKEPDLTSVCTNKMLQIVTQVLCKIRTVRSREECRLLYQHGQDLVHECDSRFTLTAQNQTVFLQLTSLKPEDSGNYTCQCSFNGGTNILHLDITVEEASMSLGVLCTTVIGGVAAFITVAGLLGYILRKIHYSAVNRDDTRPEASAASVCGSPRMLDQDDPEEQYTCLQRPASDLYQTVSTMRHQHGYKRNSNKYIATPHLRNQEKDGTEADSSSSEDYENI